MIGSIKGFVSLVQRKNLNVVQTYCSLHREVLVSKTIPDELNQVLRQVVEIVNFIKTRPLKSCLFEKMGVDMDSQHKRLILHTEARWFSREKVLCCIHKVHKELHAFFKASVNIFNVNFGFQGWNIWQRYLHILIASTQPLKTFLLHQISCLN